MQSPVIGPSAFSNPYVLDEATPPCADAGPSPPSEGEGDTRRACLPELVDAVATCGIGFIGAVSATSGVGLVLATLNGTRCGLAIVRVDECLVGEK